MFNSKIANRESGILLYGITPPKALNSHQQLEEIAVKTITRLRKLGIDGLVIYDLQDETSRNPKERPFPFSPTVDAALYASSYLSDLDIPKIIYCSVGKLTEEELVQVIDDCDRKNSIVFVGVPSRDHQVNISLSRAYQIWKESVPNVPMGAVSIPERHSLKKNEHLKITAKMESGCSFFITQCVYNIEFVKNLVSDLYYYCKKQGVQIPTIIFTITPCGSLKTLQFLDWLGIHVPNWLANELSNSHDILAKSVDLCIKIAEEIIDFCEEKSIPFGLNIESVSIKKDEIEASELLLEAITNLLEEKHIRKKYNKIKK